MVQINVEVTKNDKENSVGLLKRFTKKMQGSGVLKRARKIRYAQRSPSKYTRKKQALKKIKKTEEIEKLKKLGRI